MRLPGRIMLIKGSRYLKVMVKAAQDASRILMRHYGKLTHHQVKAKALNDFVTFVDESSQAAIIRRLKRNFPEYGVCAEEDGVNERKKRMWVIDPLDGTSNYIHGFPMFCISIGLVEDGRPIAALVLDPIHGEYFSAEKGKGAFLNGKRMRVSKTKHFRDAFLATGFPFRAKKYFGAYQRSFERIFYRSSSLRRGGSAALDLCYTACGRVDGFWEFGLAEWDVAAGILLVEEAGGTVSDFRGRPHRLNNGNIAAGNPLIHRSLIRILSTIRGFCVSSH